MPNCFSNFTPTTYEEWVTATVQSLKVRPFEKLTTSTYEGFSLQPMYRREDIEKLPHIDALPGAISICSWHIPA